MGNVFKLMRNWLSGHPGNNAKNVTPFHRSSFISTTDQPIYSWSVLLVPVLLILRQDIFVIQNTGTRNLKLKPTNFD